MRVRKGYNHKLNENQKRIFRITIGKIDKWQLNQTNKNMGKKNEEGNRLNRKTQMEEETHKINKLVITLDSLNLPL